jgi:hypothetical protein
MGRLAIAPALGLLAEISGFVDRVGSAFLRRRKRRKRRAARIARAMGIPTPTPTFRPRFELDEPPPLATANAEAAGIC